LNDPAKLAGVGMGNMIMNMVGMATVYGMNGAMETLVAQAYGNGNLYMCGVYLNRARLILTIAYIPVVIVLVQAENLLLLINQDPMVAKYAGTYITTLLPGMFLLG
jgi:MATE family multidrug resistance protein